MVYITDKEKVELIDNTDMHINLEVKSSGHSTFTGQIKCELGSSLTGAMDCRGEIRFEESECRFTGRAHLILLTLLISLITSKVGGNTTHPRRVNVLIGRDWYLLSSSPPFHSFRATSPRGHTTRSGGPIALIDFDTICWKTCPLGNRAHLALHGKFSQGLLRGSPCFSPLKFW